RVGQKLTVYKEEKSQLAATQIKERTITYKVRRGDSLARIAAKFNVSVEDIIKWNSLAGQKYIQPGQKLKLKVDVRSA
ncbi:MAG: LysM domain-containing protein, partial [Pseudomonadota bacterium]|nr:LysM domain-containing protein [Pseudomonadota bacterium]